MKWECQQLEAMGIEITSAVIDMIESAVWEINTETKKTQVQDKAMTSTGGASAQDKANNGESRLSPGEAGGYGYAPH